MKTVRRRVVRQEHIDALTQPLEEARAAYTHDEGMGFHDWWMSSLRNRVNALVMARSIFKKLQTGESVLVSKKGLAMLIDDYGEVRLLTDDRIANKEQAIQHVEAWLGPPNDI